MKKFKRGNKSLIVNIIEVKNSKYDKFVVNRMVQ